MKLNAVIPVRKGSQRVKNKNFKEFYKGLSLLDIKLNSIKNISIFDSITVDTDYKEIKNSVEKLGFNFKLRNTHYASSNISNSEYWSYFGNSYDEYVVMLNVTNPLLKTSSIVDFIDKFKQSKFDTGYTVTKVKDYLFYKDKPVNFTLNNVIKSQDLPEFYTPNFAISVASADHIKKNKSFFSTKSFLYYIDEIEGLDIDTETNFTTAQILYSLNIKN